MVALFPADHFISDEYAFMSHVAALAEPATNEAHLALVGARPTEPQTEYGWIEPGVSLVRPRIQFGVARAAVLGKAVARAG